MTENANQPLQFLDARTFQKPLGSLATTIALKVQREGPQLLVNPTFTAVDIYVMIRQASQIYDLFFFLNSDWRRTKDSDWKWAYAAVPLPLIRTMIDCLYNITVILENPAEKGRQFRESGYKKILDALDADESRYGGNEEWDNYLAEQRKDVDFEIRISGLTMDGVRSAKLWPTLSRYLRPEQGQPLNAHQQFLKTLTFGFWDEYSGIAHATFQGLKPTALFYSTSDVPHEHRSRFEEYADRAISMHLARVAGVLLCILTEVQAYFRFGGARINQRLHEVWDALLVAPEIRELHEKRYALLIRDRGIGVG